MPAAIMSDGALVVSSPIDQSIAWLLFINFVIQVLIRDNIELVQPLYNKWHISPLNCYIILKKM